MYHDLKVAVIIPAFCEEARITETIKTLPSWVDHIVAVDDASTDGTYEALANSQEPRLIVIKLPENGGVGAATLAGFERALQLDADVLVKMDGDGQMDPAQLPGLLEPIRRGEADYVKGNRFLHTRELVKMPLLRRLGNIGLSFMTKLASGYWAVFDPTNGYVAIHSAAVSLFDSTRIHKRFFFESSILCELGLNRAVVLDVYIPARYGDKISTLSERRAFFEFPPLLLSGFLRRMLIQYFKRCLKILCIGPHGRNRRALRAQNRMLNLIARLQRSLTPPKSLCRASPHNIFQREALGNTASLCD